MLKKQHLKSRSACKVTFTVPEPIEANSICVVGTFNGWDPDAHPLRKLKKGGLWRTTVELEPDTSYHFRYLIDGSIWRNDEAADGYTPNPFGAENSLVKT